MRSFTEIIDKYLNNELTAEEKKLFEEELSKNEELKKQFEAQKQVIKGVQQYGFKKAKLNKLIKTIVTLSLTVAIVAAGTYYAKKNFSGKPENNIRYELNEKGEASWSSADKHLESQIFKIDPQRDTIIETEHGIIFQVKAGTFLNKFGETVKNTVDLEVKEAMTAADVMKAGLSTTSDGKLLETGGMFYINGRDGNEILDIDRSKPINVNVPSNTNKKMSLFDGQRLKDGSINWVSPLPMKKQLATVDILSLDFYPPNFVDSLREMGFDVKNKILTDSIYYSFANKNNCEQSLEMYTADNVVMESAKSDTFRKIISTIEINSNALVYSTSSSAINGVTKEKPNGEKLFRAKCATCHSANTHAKITGPGLKDVLNRVPDRDWIKRFTLNSEKMIKEGDPYALKIFNENNKVAMTIFEGDLNNDELNAIVDYIAKGSIKKSAPKEPCIAEINPSRIRTIWDPKL